MLRLRIVAVCRHSVCRFQRRAFVPGKDMPPGPPGSKAKYGAYMRSRASDVDEAQAKLRAEHEEYYRHAKIPAPLYENAFVPGQFGMRRRVVRRELTEKHTFWDGKERWDAMEDAQLAFMR